MLTTIPTYDACEALANAAVASIQQAFPALEARFNNSITEGPLVIQARNPLNGDCWAVIGTVGPTPRNPANIEVLIMVKAFGMEPSSMTPAELGAYQKAEVAKWAQVIKAAGIKAD